VINCSWHEIYFNNSVTGELCVYKTGTCIRRWMSSQGWFCLSLMSLGSYSLTHCPLLDFVRSLVMWSPMNKMWTLLFLLKNLTLSIDIVVKHGLLMLTQHYNAYFCNAADHFCTSQPEHKLTFMHCLRLCLFSFFSARLRKNQFENWAHCVSVWLITQFSAHDFCGRIQEGWNVKLCVWIVSGTRLMPVYQKCRNVSFAYMEHWS